MKLSTSYMDYEDQYSTITTVSNLPVSMDTKILITDSQSATAHRKFLRRWNQLSRLQRSLFYTFILILFTIVLILTYSNQNNIVVKTEEIKLVEVSSENTSNSEPLVIQTVHKEKLEVDDIADLHEVVIFPGPTNERQQAVVDAFKHAWKGYKEHAWGHDNLKPNSGTAHNWFSLGLTIVDGLDTAYIMGLDEEYEEGKQWIREELTFTKNKDVNFFEVTIRVLGALLTNYHFTQDQIFLNKAKDLGERLMVAFKTPTGIPYSDVNLGKKVAHSPEWSHFSTTAEVTTVQLEFRELSRASKDTSFEEAAARVSQHIHNLPKKHGLVPIFISPLTGNFMSHATITLGARGDSYYEYLLKQWIQTGKTVDYLLSDYLKAVEGIRDMLAKRSSPNKRLFIGELSPGSEVRLYTFTTMFPGSETFNPKMDHLVCFLPGTLALGHANGLPDWHMKMAEELLHTCYLTYSVQPTFLAPEITHFNMQSATDDMYTKNADAHNLLRPEFVESLWYMYQITGNTTYQEWGWKVFQAFEKYCKVPNGYTSIANVNADLKQEVVVPKDLMESFFLSETLKYLFLLFSEDRFVLDLSKYVITSEAHALPIHKK